MSKVLRLLFVITIGCCAFLRGQAQAVDKTFQSRLTTNDVVRAMALQADNKVVIGGYIRAYIGGNSSSRQITRLNTDGSFDPSFQSTNTFNDEVRAIALQEDQRIVVGGSFTTYGGKQARRLVRLNTDGSLDASFNSGTGVDGSDDYVKTIVVLNSGKMLIGGGITRYNNKACNLVIRLNSDGSLDNTFVAAPTYAGEVESITIQADGKVLVAGDILERTTGNHSPLIRLNAEGSLDAAFKQSRSTIDYYNVNDAYTVITQPDNKILLGGYFTKYAGVNYSHLVRLNQDGTVDPSFTIGSGFVAPSTGGIGAQSGGLHDLYLQPDGKILAAGRFTGFNRNFTNGIARLNQDGSLDQNFDVCQNKTDSFGASIYKIAFQKDEKILIAGSYTKYESKDNANNIIRLVAKPSTPPLPKADFDFIVVGNEVTLQNTSVNAARYIWSFGDRSNTITTSNPSHIYNNSGIFDLTLTAYGFCGSESKITKKVNVLGLQSASPSRGGNNGSVIVTIVGSNFTDKTIAKLVRNGKEILGINPLYSENGRTLNVKFELYDQPLGVWDLVVGTGSSSRTLKNFFTIEAGVLPIIQTSIVGRDVVRTGSTNKYSLVLSNTGNVDASGVPVWIAVPAGTKINFNSPILVPAPSSTINYDTTSLYTTVDSLFDDLPNADVYGFLVHKIPTRGTVSIEIDATLNAKSSLYIWSTTPYYGSPLKYFVGECIDKVIGQVTSFIPIVGCAYGLSDLLVSPIVAVVDYEEVKNKYRKYSESYKILDNSFIRNAYTAGVILLPYKGMIEKIMFDCVPAAKGLKLTAMVVKKIIKPTNIATTAFTCKDYFYKRDNISKRVITTVASLDPNEKSGPKGLDNKNYILGHGLSNYTIFFENKSSASAPAQEVVVLDTLDKSKFDLSTFQLMNYGFQGAARATIPLGLKEYSSNTLLKRTGKPDLLVRVYAKLDTATGILRCRFLSLDPVSKELIEDPLDGFLPPNKVSPEGEGFVAYAVKPKVDLAHEAELKNKAEIFFDNNSPITTNEFINTIDKRTPTSKVASLPVEVRDTVFTVTWSGSDNGSGIRAYDVYYAKNNEPFQLWLYDTPVKASSFVGQRGMTYNFYCLAKDYAGNIELNKTTAEATVRIVDVVTSVKAVIANSLNFQSYPNPSTGEVILEFNLLVGQQVNIVIQDITGREVAVVTNKIFTAGVHKLPFSLMLLRAGMYISKIQCSGYTKSIKLLKQ